MAAVHAIKESSGFRSRMQRQALEKLAIGGDFRGLSDDERATYLIGLTESLGLDASWRPIRFVETDQGTLELYILAIACYALGAQHELSITASTIIETEDAYHCDCVVRGPSGREVRASGSVSKKGRSGQKLCDARMHAETKAHRRGILKWLGLGCLDEQEASDMGGARYTTTESGALTGDALADDLASQRAGQREARVTAQQIRMYHAIANDMEWSAPMLDHLLGVHGYTQPGEIGRHAEFDVIVAKLADPRERDLIREQVESADATPSEAHH